MNPPNKEVNKIYSKFNNKSGLCFLSMQVLFCLSEKTLAEEIESMMSITFLGTSHQNKSICKVCEVTYHEDDQIVEFDICIAAPKYEDCIKACSDLMIGGYIPENAECIFERNQRSEKLISQLWHEHYDKKVDKQDL